MARSEAVSSNCWNEPRLVLYIAGRSLDRARAYCETRDTAKAKLVPTTFDRDGDLSAHLVPLRPHVLVDASGPFQTYGQGRYRVIEACIAHGIHYLDLADGSDFVEGVHAFDPAARRAGVFVLSGVSSFPVLTAAVVRRLSAGMARVESVAGGVAPSPHADIGLNVLRAIASYAGTPLILLRDGRKTSAHAL